MRVLVLGGNGFIGQRIVAALREDGTMTPVVASRRAPASPAGSLVEQRQVDTLDGASLAAAIQDVDAIVNSVAGDAAAIADGARRLVEAASQAARPPRIVHLSSMAVYGAAEGVVSERTPVGSALGWYGQAKCEAEAHLAGYARAGHPVVILRPGCVYGPGSDQWVGRIGSLLRSHRLGDLGAAGDGWSNLIHVDDVAAAVASALQVDDAAAGWPRVFNLAAPDSPRWNQYFVDLGTAIGATPVRRLPFRRVKLDALLLGPLFKIADIAGRRIGISAKAPVPISPSLLKLWSQHVFLDSSAAIGGLRLEMRAYPAGLKDSADWFSGRKSAYPK